MSRRRRSSASRRAASKSANWRAASVGAAQLGERARQRVPGLVPSGRQLQGAGQRDDGLGIAPAVEEEPADRGVRLRVARVDEQGRHQLGERVVAAPVGGVGAGELLVERRLVGREPRPRSRSASMAAAVSPSTCASRARPTCSTWRPASVPAQRGAVGPSRVGDAVLGLVPLRRAKWAAGAVGGLGVAGPRVSSASTASS